MKGTWDLLLRQLLVLRFGVSQGRGSCRGKEDPLSLLVVCGGGSAWCFAVLFFLFFVCGGVG